MRLVGLDAGDVRPSSPLERRTGAKSIVKWSAGRHDSTPEPPTGRETSDSSDAGGSRRADGGEQRRGLAAADESAPLDGARSISILPDEDLVHVIVIVAECLVCARAKGPALVGRPPSALGSPSMADALLEIHRHLVNAAVTIMRHAMATTSASMSIRAEDSSVFTKSDMPTCFCWAHEEYNWQRVLPGCHQNHQLKPSF